MEKILKLYTYVDGGVNDTLFPNAEDPIEIGAFRYDAARMGGAPSITASVNYPSCLDNVWTSAVYAEFNGEKYYLKQTPTSSYNNEDVLYKHDLELVSERAILDNVYFFDAVVDEPEGDDKPVSNSTKVVFFGDIHEFAKRLQSSLAYSGIDYEVYVDSGVSTEGKLISFEDAFFSNVLQEIYNTYEQPYYFNFYTDEEGARHKEIRIGKTNRVIEREFAYGADDALLSITKNNANYKVVNRATATGSSDNIPFYYPNNSPKGEIAAVCSNPNATATIIDHELYSNEIEIDGVITKNNIEYENLVVTRNGSEAFSGQSISSSLVYGGIVDRFYATFDAKNTGNLVVSFKTINDDYFISEDVSENSWVSTRISVVLSTPEVVGVTRGDTLFELRNVYSVEDIEIPINKALDGYQLTFEVRKEPMGGYANKWGTFSYNPIFSFGSASGWFYNGKAIDLADIGLEVSGEEASGDTITQTLIKYVKTSENLMPSIYRESDGAERFYNATNGLYPFEPEEGYELKSNEYILDGLVHNDNYKNEDGEYIEFNNPYTEGRPKEHIITVEDIKPTIEKTEVNGFRIDMFSEFAYDEDDNDETYEDEEGNVYFKHPYFYGKLRVMDFNLFEHAIEDQPMTISFTSGDVGACNFEIGVTEEYPQKNPVQVYEEDTIIDDVLHEAGSLKRDSEGRVLAGVEGTQQQVTEFQERQQDTSKYEVWIALKKEEETYGILMPQGTFRPKADENGTNEGDTFVILGINLPKVYITNAEKLLEAEIIKYIKDNNNEKFNFSIKFSRIFFAEEENEEIFGALNENAQITVRYNNIPYTLYVSSYSYSMNDGETLPEISVELSESLSVSQNALQNAVSEIKGQIKSFAYATDTAISMQTASYIQKQADDEAHGLVNFTKGIKFGEGGKVEILDNNSAKLTIEYLEVTKKASFTSLEIKEKTHVGGQMLITPAAINCGEVEELDDAYRCYFQTKGADGDEIFNQFAAGDQAICQTFNAWGSRYYWRLVTAIGEDYIDLSKTVCDEDSDIPSAGDKIIQLGNQVDEDRQNAIVIAAYGDGSPYIIQYKGIDSFEIPDEKIVTKLSSTENIFTGKVHMELGSDGLESLEGWTDINATISDLEQAISNAEAELENVYDKAKVDGLIDASEQAAIDAAQKKVDAAKEELEQYTDEAVDGLEVGGQNLLRNSGFTGDYLSEPLADEDVLDASSELYSAPFDHWSITQGITRIDASGVSQSGYGVELLGTGDELRQVLYYSIVPNASYALSFVGKGGSVSYRIGDASGSVVLTEDWAKYEVVVTPTTTSVAFALYPSNNATVQLCDIQLVQGNKSTSWSNSTLDNSSDRAYYQSMKYLSSAIADGSTDVWGGLVMTNTMLLGNAGDDVLNENTAGVNGVVTDDSYDVAFWAGGTLTQATDTMMKYIEDPSYQATDEEIAAMAKFVVTHGGRAILNDMILRGYIYAEGGKIGQIEIVDNGIGVSTTSGGRIKFTPTGLIATQSDGSFTELGTCGSQAIAINGKDAGGVCYDNEDTYKIAAQINADDGYHAIHSLSGVYAGLRPNIRSTEESMSLNELDHTIVVENSIEITLTLPTSPLIGQEYKIIHTNANKVNIDSGSSAVVVDVVAHSAIDSISFPCSLTLTYYNTIWHAEYGYK